MCVSTACLRVTLLIVDARARFRQRLLRQFQSRARRVGFRTFRFAKLFLSIVGDFTGSPCQISFHEQSSTISHSLATQADNV